MNLRENGTSCWRKGGRDREEEEEEAEEKRTANGDWKTTKIKPN